MHSIFLCNSDGLVLFKRYYVAIASQCSWENKLYGLTHKRWPHARNEIHQCVTFEDKYIVFTFWGEILVILVGTDEYDELALSDVLDVLAEYFRENITKRPLQELSEQQITQSEAYEKMCLGIDEMISAVGILDQTDVSKVGSNYKAKVLWNNRPKTSVPSQDKQENTSFEDVPYSMVRAYLQRNGYPEDFVGQT